MSAVSILNVRREIGSPGQNSGPQPLWVEDSAMVQYAGGLASDDWGSLGLQSSQLPWGQHREQLREPLFPASYSAILFAPTQGTLQSYPLGALHGLINVSSVETSAPSLYLLSFSFRIPGNGKRAIQPHRPLGLRMLYCRADPSLPTS